MQNRSHFTTCNICNRSIQSGEQYISLNFHRETGNNQNAQKTITVHYAETSVTTCIDCGTHLESFALSSDLVDHLRNKIHNTEIPSASKEYTIRNSEVSSILGRHSIHPDDRSGLDTDMTINEVDGMTDVPVLNEDVRTRRRALSRELKVIANAQKLNLSKDQIEYLTSVGSGNAAMIVSLLERSDCSHNFDQAVKAVMVDFPF